MLKFLSTVAVCAQLQGCFFFFVVPDIPVAQSYCVNVKALPGDRIRLTDDRLARIVSISGASSSCTDPRFPLRAKLDFG
jgi:hypothetical protein